MALKLKIFACDNDHKILSSSKNESRFDKGKIVCGTCGKRMSAFKSASWSASKHFLCEHGHVITITPFNNGNCNLSWGGRQGEYTNVDKTPEEFTALLNEKKVLCPVGSCGSNLTSLEGNHLEVPKLLVAKTRTRVGDLWDRQGCPRPVAGSYDKNYNFRESEFTQRNKERVKKLKTKRNTKPVGEIITKATEKNYKSGEKAPTKEDL